MKTEEEVDVARARVRGRILTPGLNNEQKALLMGMANALCWVVGAPNGSTMERVLSDEPMSAGTSAPGVMERFDAAIRGLQ